MLPLTFSNPDDYTLVSPSDKVSINVSQLAPGKQLTMTLHKADGSVKNISLNHTFNDMQITWFKNGSALNYIRKSIKN